MRNVVKAGLVLVLLLGVSLSMAQTSVTIGGSYWRGGIEYTIGDETSQKASNMIGPYVNLRQGKWSLGVSYFSGTYDYSEDENIQELYDALLFLEWGFIPNTDITYEVKRKDLNISAGYALSRNVSVFGAFKSITGEIETAVNFTDANMSAFSTSNTDSETGSFVGGGVSLRLPLAPRLFLFGSAAYLSATDDDWNDLTSVNVGVGAHSRSGISVLVGYRMDKFLGSDEDEGEDIDIKGIMATVAYTIRTK